jgi:CRP/FNR family transcriptional regulator, cyclic AMP receptor protein
MAMFNSEHSRLAEHIVRPDDRHAMDARTLPPELLEEFIRLGHSRSFPKGTIVVLEGEPAEALYVIQEGRLRVYVTDEEGHDVELNILGPGEFFGELMLGSPVRAASVKTLTPARLTMIRRDEFQQILAARPDIAFVVIQTLIHRVLLLSKSVQGLVAMDVYGRVARLLQESAREADGRSIVTALSQQAIADRVGASRSMVNRILKDLQEGGYISVARHEIVLHRALPKHW